MKTACQRLVGLVVSASEAVIFLPTVRSTGFSRNRLRGNGLDSA